MTHAPSRRALLKGLGAACCFAAHPLVTPVALAQAPGEARLVVIVLRGAMDGLGALAPVGDPGWAALRPDPGPVGAPVGGGFFALHPSLAPLRPLFRAGEAGAVHAVSTPYRDKRSHFDGQDILEAGTAPDAPREMRRQGWLNRLIQTMPRAEGRTAFAVGREEMRILSGAAEVAEWAPDTALDLGPQARLLLGRIYAGDPLLAGAAEEAADLAEALSGEGTERGTPPAVALARFAAARLSEESRIAAFSVSGWDTHRRQGLGLAKALGALSEAILELRAGLGPHWQRTAVLAVTEFGRTARINGSGGTDHGTGGAMLTAGGALRGGEVLADWPGLSEAALYEGRDLMPTRDVRAHMGWALHALFGTPLSDIERIVFPGLEMGPRSALV